MEHGTGLWVLDLRRVFDIVLLRLFEGTGFAQGIVFGVLDLRRVFAYVLLFFLWVLGLIRALCGTVLLSIFQRLTAHAAHPE